MVLTSWPTKALYFQLGSTLSRLHYVALPQDLREYRWQLSSRAASRRWCIGRASWTRYQTKLSVSERAEAQWTAFAIPYNSRATSTRRWLVRRYSHRDLAPRNILINVDGIWLVDWEAATIGHPDLDVARLFGAEIEDLRSASGGILGRLWPGAPGAAHARGPAVFSLAVFVGNGALLFRHSVLVTRTRKFPGES